MHAAMSGAAKVFAGATALLRAVAAQPVRVGSLGVVAAGLMVAGPAVAGSYSGGSTEPPVITMQPEIQPERLAKFSYLSRLQVLNGGGEFEELVSEMTINTPLKYVFLWSTGKSDYSSAQWQIGLQGSQAVLASGALPQASFEANKKYDFLIHLEQVLPSQPSAQPKTYWVRVVPKQGQEVRPASTPVKITYAKPGPAPTFDF
jgi:hypothetical protein